MNSDNLIYKISSFRYNNETRFICQNKQNNLAPSLALSIYESDLSQTKGSPGSVENDLKNLNYIFTWAYNNQYPIDDILCSGSPPEAAKIRAFGHWVKLRTSKKKRNSAKLSIKTYNIIFATTNKMFCWFIEQYNPSTGDSTERTLKIETLCDATKKVFKKLKRKDRTKSEAPDIDEDEIKAIENYLKPDNRIQEYSKPSPDVIAMINRDYIMWRLVIELGIRISEVLALRIEDCPHRGQDYIRIIRIDDRGENYNDPRKSTPRVKTLSRDLGFILKKSPIPDLLNDYISKHRFKTIKQHRKKVRRPVFGQANLLLLAHRNGTGTPLTISGAEDIAVRISKNTGVDFNWHLGRHAFFNRAYSAIIDNPDFKDRKKDLIYWGGWEKDESLDTYIQRARSKRAKKALIFWQDGGTEWEALK